MNRFFGKSDNIYEDYIVIDGGDVNHIRNVLRLKIGEKLVIVGGDNCEYVCSVKEYEEDKVILDILETSDSKQELATRVFLFQGLPKGDKMETIIQKCVELGVYEIIPVDTRRTIAKIEPKKIASKTARFQAISESAAKQSHRNIIPTVKEIMSFKEALKYADSMNVKLIPYELSEGMEATKKAVDSIKAGDSVAIFIGPEGGFEACEVDEATTNGFIPISLGQRILRTETAGMMLMSVIMYTLETQR